MSEGESGEPTTFKYYQHILDGTIEQALNGELNIAYLFYLEADADTKKYEW